MFGFFRPYCVILLAVIMAACAMEQNDTSAQDRQPSIEQEAEAEAEAEACLEPLKVTLKGLDFNLPRERVTHIHLGNNPSLRKKDFPCEERVVAQFVTLRVRDFGIIDFPEPTWVESRGIIDRAQNPESLSQDIEEGMRYLQTKGLLEKEDIEFARARQQKSLALKTNTRESGIVEYMTGYHHIFEIPSHFIPLATQDKSVFLMCGKRRYSVCRVSFDLLNGLQYRTRHVGLTGESKNIDERLTGIISRTNQSLDEVESYLQPAKSTKQE